MSRVPHAFPILRTFDTRILIASLALLLLALPAQAQWTNQANVNTVVSTTIDYPHVNQVVAGPSSGSFVLWSTLWAGGSVYLQFIDSAGVRQVNDELVAGTGYYPVMVADGSGGVIVAWIDGSSKMRAQKYDASLNAQWAGSTLLASSGVASDPAITTDGSGGAIVSWTHRTSSNSQADIHAQHVNASGVQQWNTTTGYVVVALSTNERRSAIAPGSAGGDAFVVWEDGRAGTSNNDIWARYIDPSGTGTWPVEQPVVNAPYSQLRPKVIADGSGGAVVAWQDSRNGLGELYAQRLTSTGLHSWSPWNGVLVGDGVYSLGYDLGSNGSGGAVLAWSSYSDIKYQELDSTGAKQWGSAGLALTSGSTLTNQRINPSLADDGTGGAVVAWNTMSKINSNVGDIYAQYVDPSTGAAWTAGGLVVSNATGAQHNPDVSASSECPAKVVWNDYRTSTGDMYIQRIKCPGVLGLVSGGGVLVAHEHAHELQVHETGEIGVGTGTIDDLELVDYLSDIDFEMVFDPKVIRVREVMPGTLEGLEVEIDGEAGIVRLRAAGGEAGPGSRLFTLVVEGVADGTTALAYTRASAGKEVFVGTVASVLTVGRGEGGSEGGDSDR